VLPSPSSMLLLLLLLLLLASSNWLAFPQLSHRTKCPHGTTHTVLRFGVLRTRRQSWQSLEFLLFLLSAQLTSLASMLIPPSSLLLSPLLLPLPLLAVLGRELIVAGPGPHFLLMGRTPSLQSVPLSLNRW
jgi:hypothetical protein